MIYPLHSGSEGFKFISVGRTSYWWSIDQKRESADYDRLVVSYGAEKKNAKERRAGMDEEYEADIIP